MRTGTIDVANKTFDISGVNETETSILLTNTQISFTYRDEQGQLIKITKPVNESIETYSYTKTVTDPRNAVKGQRLEVYKQGYMCPGKKRTGPKMLMDVDWASHNFQTKTFTDGAQTYEAVLVPLSL